MLRGTVIFDESGFLSEEMMKVYGAFAIVNKSFKSGKDRDGNRIDPIRLRTFPLSIPNQKIYISSASSTDTEFYRLYREFAKEQLMGNPDYCVIHVDCEVAFSPTIKGEVVNPLLTRSTVETEMRTNPEKTRREYYCEFTTDAGKSAIVRRGTITRNSETRKPLLYNDTGNKKFIIAYDPARSRDNSVILVCEVYTVDCGDVKDIRMRVVNCINLIDVGKKIKSPMKTPDQIAYLKQVIIDYNGGADGYENILCVYIDAGSGGAGVNIADFLMEDWRDKDGVIHRGLVDRENMPEEAKNFPNAVDKIRLMAPTKYKSEMFEALIELIDQDKVSFTATYDNKGYLTLFDVDEKKMAKEKAKIIEEMKKDKVPESEFNRILEERLKEVPAIKTRRENLDWVDEIALSGIDALKEELVNMVRIERQSGKDSFELIPEKANKLHDDRAYTLAMCCYGLMKERRKNITSRKRSSVTGQTLVDKLPMRKARIKATFN